MINLLQKINEDNYNMVSETPYIFNNHYVPRVTAILSSMLHEDYIVKWSNYLGFKRQKYEIVLNEAAQKGSYTHNSIENFIQNDKDIDINSIPIKFQNAVKNAYDSFQLWWNIITQNNIEILMQEEKLACEWFGGTLDLLIKINGKIYLLDFKTSNHPSYKYFLQLSAYKYMLKETRGIELDGCGIIMLDKECIHFNEILIDFSVQFDIDFINHCQETFFSLIYGYYNRLRIESEFKQILKRVG